MSDQEGERRKVGLGARLTHSAASPCRLSSAGERVAIPSGREGGEWEEQVPQFPRESGTFVEIAVDLPADITLKTCMQGKIEVAAVTPPGYYLSSRTVPKKSAHVSLLLILAISGWKKDSSILARATRDALPRPALRAKAPAMMATKAAVPTDAARSSRLLVNLSTDVLVFRMALLADINMSMAAAARRREREAVSRRSARSVG